MPTATFKGVIKKINPTETVGTKDFKKRSFLLAETEGNYPSTYMLETHKDYCAKLDEFAPGQIVTCEVEITGREWNDKAFNTLKAFRISIAGAIQHTPAAASIGGDSDIVSEHIDDLPF